MFKAKVTLTCVWLSVLFFAGSVSAKFKVISSTRPNWGYINKHGDMVIAPKFYSAGKFSGGKAGVGISDSRKIFIDSRGRELFNTSFMAWSLMEEHDGLTVVTGPTEPIKEGEYLRLEKYSYLDHQGKLWDKQYGICSDFHEGVAVVLSQKSPETHSVIDKQGRTLFALDELPSRFEFSEGVLCAKSKGKCGFLDKKKHWVIPPSFAEAHSFKDGLAAVARIVRAESQWGVIDQSRWGFIDHSGKLVIPYQFNIVEDFHDGRAKFFENGRKEGFVDASGKTVIAANSRIYEGFSEGMLGFRENSLYGFLDRSNQIAIEPKFRGVGTFNDGLCAAAIEADGKDLWGFIDHKGNWVIKPVFKLAGAFSEGLAAVRVDDSPKP